MAAQAASPLVGQVVLPGDQVAVVLPDVAAATTAGDTTTTTTTSAAARVVRVGAGLRAEPQPIASSSKGGGVSIAATKAGVLRAAPRTGQLSVDGVRARRYLPREDDPVVGAVLDRAGGEHYSIDIGAPHPALLPVLAFEGATRRNRPMLGAGDLVYARVVSAPRDADATLACTDAAGQSAGFGPLAGGAMARVAPAFARALLRSKPPAPVLVALGKHAGAFEVAVGANGRVWVAAPTIFGLASVVRALEAAEAVPPTEAERWVERTLREWREAAGGGGGGGGDEEGGGGRRAAAAAERRGEGDDDGDGDEGGEMELDMGLG